MSCRPGGYGGNGGLGLCACSFVFCTLEVRTSALKAKCAVPLNHQA